MFRVIVIIVLMLAACEDEQSADTSECDTVSGGMCWVNVGYSDSDTPACPSGDFRYPTEEELQGVCVAGSYDDAVPLLSDEVPIMAVDDTPHRYYDDGSVVPIEEREPNIVVKCGEDADNDFYQYVCVREIN